MSLPHLQQALNLGDTGGTADQHDVVDQTLVHLGVTQALLHRVHALAEQVHAQLLKPEEGEQDKGVNPFFHTACDGLR